MHVLLFIAYYCDYISFIALLKRTDLPGQSYGSSVSFNKCYNAHGFVYPAANKRPHCALHCTHIP